MFKEYSQTEDDGLPFVFVFRSMRLLLVSMFDESISSPFYALRRDLSQGSGNRF